ncbi:MAG: phenylalanine--tRNA ligase subunit beta [Thermodesulfobacteriota bacterium]
MIVSMSWLKDYVDIGLSAGALADALTMRGLEVEAVRDRYAYLSSVKVARILEAGPHPRADKLTLCRVDAGDGEVTIVCGAPNARKGLLTALALPGTELPSGAIVNEAEIRGVLSKGMLCSESELGLSDDAAGILELPGRMKPGTPIARALKLSDFILEIGVTPNRPDCLCMLGVAREVAAITGKKLRLPETGASRQGGETARLTSVAIEAPQDCPRYVARLLLNAKIGPSPFWLRDRLSAVGQRPLNNIVDVTNYVMLELGQPLHAFDLDLLEERRIVVRRALPGEPFVTLDGQKRELLPENLMICDGKKPVALAGVMGGLNSEINGNTQNVLLESAYFSPMSVRRTSKKLGYHTEASHRFERGVDPEGQLRAADRAIALMAEVSGGTVVKGAVDSHPAPVKRRKVTLSVKQANRILGTKIPGQKMAGLISSVDIPVTKLDRDRLSATIPGFRPDISRPEDLVEEVARLWGFDRIPVTTPQFPMEAENEDGFLAFRRSLRAVMTGLGFSEAVNYSFAPGNAGDLLDLSPEDRRRSTVALLNPLSEDMAVMRSSLCSGLLAAAGRNVNQQNRDLAMFELGKTFVAVAGEKLPQETFYLAAVLCGSRQPASWAVTEQPRDFYDAKGAVEAVLAAFKIQGARFSPAGKVEFPYLRPGHGAEVRHGDLLLGCAGQVSPSVARRFDIKAPIFLVELNAHHLSSLAPEAITFAPPSRYPSVTRDITLIVARAAQAQDVIARVLSMGNEWVESMDAIDVYVGNPIAEGKKSMTFRITYRSFEATLTDAEVNTLHEKIGRDLVQAFNAELP